MAEGYRNRIVEEKKREKEGETEIASGWASLTMQKKLQEIAFLEIRIGLQSRPRGSPECLIILVDKRTLTFLIVLR